MNHPSLPPEPMHDGPSAERPAWMPSAFDRLDVDLGLDPHAPRVRLHLAGRSEFVVACLAGGAQQVRDFDGILGDALDSGYGELMHAVQAASERAGPIC